MAFEHQARIIGMGLLLGEISFQGLVSGWQNRMAEEGEPDLEALLAELHRQGLLRTEALDSLRAQVLDLERLLNENGSGGDGDSSAEQTATSIVDWVPGPLPATLPKDYSKTPSVLPNTLPPTRGHGEELGHRLLSVLTLPRWNQFVNLQFVGEGGMGRVFRAYDPTLNRQVALKFLRWANAKAITDLVREARNQAQVDHPNICKVYEVKEWHGQVYIVLQYIDGTTLERIAPQLSDLEKIELMERVAEAVHAAHRQGLIHRDLKPANIMVERKAEGGFVPYVLDFGLARDTDFGNETREGTIQGTTHYMAPEQARGDTGRIERRTDVYALGVTLYELFTGAPPFSEAVGMDCLQHILNGTIPPPQSRNPDLASDLQTIILKCLEKDLPRRYESARALAEDLRRFRDGEPIHARPASLPYRFGKFARRNRSIVALGAVALVLVLVFAGLGLHARVTAASRAQWAQHFGQEAERIEALLRYARLQPTHDIRGELATVRLRIQAMEAEVKGAGAAAQGPGHYALGRAFLALGETSQAQSHLDLAWEAQFRGRDVAYSRGRALSQAYTKAMEAARAIQDARLRETRIQELEETLRNPAIALLREGQGSLLDPPGFQEGLLALHDKRFEECLRLTRNALARAPWFYEARSLEGEVHLERARLERDPARILAALDQAGVALMDAATIAPSDPNLCDLQSRRWLEELTARRHAGQPMRESLLQLEASCGTWKRLLPDTLEPEARLAWGEIEWARVPAYQSEALPRSLSRTEALCRVHPDHPELIGALAAGLQLRAYSDLNRGRDPRADLDRAILLLQRALAADAAAFELYEPYVGCFWAKVEYEKNQGQDPSQTVQMATDTLQGLARRHPKVPDFQGFLGGIQVELADYQATHGIDPGPVVLRALSHLDLAIRIAPARFEFHFSKGNAHLAWAQYLLLQGQSPRLPLDEAEAAFQEALDCNASAQGAMIGLGEARLLRAYHLDHSRLSPLQTLSRAEGSISPLRDQKSNWRVKLFFAQTALLRARWNPDPRPQLQQAEAAANQALRLGGRLPESLLVTAKVQMEWANRFHLESPRRSARARSLLREILSKDAAFEPAKKLAASSSGKLLY